MNYRKSRPIKSEFKMIGHPIALVLIIGIAGALSTLGLAVLNLTMFPMIGFAIVLLSLLLSLAALIWYGRVWYNYYRTRTYFEKVGIQTPWFKGYGLGYGSVVRFVEDYFSEHANEEALSATNQTHADILGQLSEKYSKM